MPSGEYGAAFYTHCAEFLLFAGYPAYIRAVAGDDEKAMIKKHARDTSMESSAHAVYTRARGRKRKREIERIVQG